MREEISKIWRKSNDRHMQPLVPQLPTSAVRFRILSFGIGITMYGIRAWDMGGLGFRVGCSLYFRISMLDVEWRWWELWGGGS